MLHRFIMAATLPIFILRHFDFGQNLEKKNKNKNINKKQKTNKSKKQKTKQKQKQNKNKNKTKTKQTNKKNTLSQRNFSMKFGSK